MAHTIAIVGAGSVGSALGRVWARAGHTIRYGVRDAGEHAGLTDHATLSAPLEAVAEADVVVLAVPFAAAVDVVTDLGDLGARTVIDATNPLGPDLRRDPYVTPSGAQVLAGAATRGRFVKACNTTGAENMADAGRYEPAPTMWLAGDHDEALEVAAGLAHDLGFAPVVAGSLEVALELEHLAALWITLARHGQHGPDVTISLQSAA